MNPTLRQISRRCSSLRAVIIDPLATSQGVREQLGFATVVADQFQVRLRRRSLWPELGWRQRLGCDAQGRNLGDIHLRLRG